MTSRDFCYWLQGWFELNGAKGSNLTVSQTESVQRHLAMVFKHEIDPSMGSAAHQEELQEAHGTRPTHIGGHAPSGALIRC